MWHLSAYVDVVMGRGGGGGSQLNVMIWECLFGVSRINHLTILKGHQIFYCRLPNLEADSKLFNSLKKLPPPRDEENHAE